MERTTSLRTIKLAKDAKVKLAKIFGCTERMVYKALCYEGDTKLARKIRFVALKELGGWIEVCLPEVETMHDSDSVIRQYFGEQVVLELSKLSGEGRVLKNGVVLLKRNNVMLKDIGELQLYAMGVE